MNHEGSNYISSSDRPEPTINIQQAAAGSSISRLLYMLLQAHEYARELDRDLWDFAVGLPELKEAGICSSDIRWVLCKGFAIHASETTTAGDPVRSFQQQKHLAVRKRSCFVLTNAGVDFAQRVATQSDREIDDSAPFRFGCLFDHTFGHIASVDLAGFNNSPVTKGAVGDPNYGLDLFDDQSMVPKWDCVRQELRLGPHVVKVFKLHSPNQAVILGTFEEESWPTRIDDPLPPHLEIDPKQRLHDTIKSLNRNHVSSLLRFRGDGTGQGVRWELRKKPFETANQKEHAASSA